MTEEWSYPSLKCILQYLEANKRIHISSRSPILRRFEKSIPLHLDYLYISPDIFMMNRISSKIWRNEEVLVSGSVKNRRAKETLTPGDLRFGIDRSKFLEIIFVDSDDLGHLSHRVPDGIRRHEAVKTMMCSLLGRHDIYVDHLEFHVEGEAILRLPENFRLRARKLETAYDDFRGFLSLINPSSFPLRELVTEALNMETINHDVLKSARKLVIVNHDDDIPDWLYGALESIPNEELVIEKLNFRDEENELVRLVRSYLRRNRKVGCSWRIDDVWKCDAWKGLCVIEDEIDGVTNVMFHEEIDRVNHITSILIPIDSASALLIYAVNHPGDDTFHVDIVMEVISRDAPNIYEIETEELEPEESEPLWMKFILTYLCMTCFYFCGCCALLCVAFVLFHNWKLGCFTS